jgi:hypothetical protein
MKKIVLLLVVASFFIASPVMEFNSSSLLNKCIEAEKFFQEIEADKTKALFCIGYLAAVVDTYESLKNRNKEPLFCLPRKHEELFVLTFVKFLKNNPDRGVSLFRSVNKIKPPKNEFLHNSLSTLNEYPENDRLWCFLIHL